MLFRKHLVMFGPREVLLTSDEPVVRQFLGGRIIAHRHVREKDEAQMAEEQAMVDAGHHDGGVEEIERVCRSPSDPGHAGRQAVGSERIREIMHTCHPTPEAIRDDLEGTPHARRSLVTRRAAAPPSPPRGTRHRRRSR